MVLEFILFVAGVLALGVSVTLYNAAHVPAGRHRLNVILTAATCPLAVFIAAGVVGWFFAASLGLMLVAALMLTTAWAWKVDNWVERRTTRVLAARPDLEQAFGQNPILKRLMKKPPR
jgi:hypothetical protein